MRTQPRKRKTTQGLGRRERRRAETREKLFRTAMELFARRGFFETTTTDITEAADVGQGTFFNYFPSKQHVLTALFEMQLNKVQAARQTAEATRSSVKRVLHDLIHHIGEEPGRSQSLTRSLLVAFLSNDAVREFACDMLDRGRQDLEAIMVLGQEKGEIRRDLQASDLALAYQKGVLGTLLFFALQRKCDLDAESELTFKLFWAAAAARKGKVR
jgi:AcrR family transcriptional regulator